MLDPNVIAATIQQVVSNSPTKGLTGNQIRQAIRTAHPEFAPTNYASNLRDFIRRFASDIVEKSRSGQDIVYALRTLPDSQQETLFDLPAPAQRTPKALSFLHENREVWKTFTSPGSPWKLFLEPEAMLMRVTSPSEPSPGPEWVEVPHCSAEVLLQMARSFTDTEVPESFRAIVAATLNERKWWLPFFDTLRNIGLRVRWIVYRRRLISDEFERAINFALQQKRAANLLPPRSADHIHVLPAEDKAPAVSSALLRRLASIAIDKMTDAELRSLNVPLGYIIDALKSE